MLGGARKLIKRYSCSSTRIYLIKVATELDAEGCVALLDADQSRTIGYITRNAGLAFLAVIIQVYYRAEVLLNYVQSEGTKFATELSEAIHQTLLEIEELRASDFLDRRASSIINR